MKKTGWADFARKVTFFHDLRLRNAACNESIKKKYVEKLATPVFEAASK